MFLSGCFGGNPTRPIEPPTEKKESEKLRAVHTGAGEYTRKVSPEGPEKLWTVNWQSADLQYEEGRAFGTMENVSGNIFDGEKQVGDFASANAVTKKDSKVLSLSGQVRITSKEKKATLYCDEMEWHADERVIVAKGNVHVEAQGYEFGHAPVLLSAPDLSEVATPNLYKNLYGTTHPDKPSVDKMEVKQKLAATIASMAAFAMAQQANLVLQGKDGSFEIRNAKSFSLVGDPAKPGVTTFHASGSPVIGVIGAQKMTAKANQIDGKAQQSGRTKFLETATLTGNVHVEAKRPSKKVGSDQEQTIILDSQSAVYTRDLEKVTFDHEVTVNQNDLAAGQAFKITGSKGFFTLYPPDDKANSKRAIRMLQLEGPVHFTLKSQRQIEEGTPAKKSWAPYTIAGQCQELSYDDSTRKLVLNGGVKVNSDDPVYPIQSTARKVTIVLDEEGNPIEIHGEGEPGVTEARQKPPKR